MEDLEAFGRLITALRPWLAQVVVVGGWAHRLHRFHPLANPAAHPPLGTRDADVAFPLDAELTGDIQAALHRAGFVQELFGDLVPPATHYRLGEEDAGADLVTCSATALGAESRPYDLLRAVRAVLHACHFGASEASVSCRRMTVHTGRTH